MKLSKKFLGIVISILMIMLFFMLMLLVFGCGGGGEDGVVGGGGGAQPSPGYYLIGAYVCDSGGSWMISNSYEMIYSMGQPSPVGESGSANYRLVGGTVAQVQ